MREEHRTRTSHHPGAGARLARAAGRAAAGLALTVLACAAPAEEWEEIPAARSRIVTTLPVLRDAPSKTASRSKRAGSTQEMMAYGMSGLTPLGQVMFWEIEPFSTSVFTDATLPAADDHVKQLFPKLPISTGEMRDVENVVGEGQSVRFELLGQDCVFVRVFDGYVPPDMFLLGGVSANILGKMMLLGWHCAQRGASGDGWADAFIQSLGVRGYAVPDGG